MGKKLMAVIWNLRGWLKERGVKRASEVSRIVLERTGYKLSVQAVCDLLNGQPKMIRIETTQALCDAFYCRLSDFFEVMPIAAMKPPTKARRQHGARNSLKPELGQGSPALGSKQSGSAGMSPDISKVDFAAFYPNAHEFSSRLRANE
jgi:DNA-binding Xre family transcriptional regulator